MASKSKLVPHRQPTECRDAKTYTRHDLLGKGTFGEVYKAQCQVTGEFVALKKILSLNDEEEKTKDEGFPRTFIREITILKNLNHENVLGICTIALTAKSIYLVCEFMDHDLSGLIKSHGCTFTLPQIKSYVRQMFEGLFYMHNHNILHRDLKCSNILVNNKGVLKLGDFGLARYAHPSKISVADLDRRRQHRIPLTNRVVTLWYRAPELLLGAEYYDGTVDTWGAGLIVAELFTTKPLLQGANEIEQFVQVIELCGTPNERNWPGVSKQSLYHSMPILKGPPYRRNVKNAIIDQSKPRIVPVDALELIDQLLVLNPSKRLTAQQVLDHPFLWNDPEPCPPQYMPTYPSTHEHHVLLQQANSTQKQQLMRAPIPMMPSNSRSRHKHDMVRNNNGNDRRQGGRQRDGWNNAGQRGVNEFGNMGRGGGFGGGGGVDRRRDGQRRNRHQNKQHMQSNKNRAPLPHEHFFNQNEGLLPVPLIYEGRLSP